MTKTVDLTEAIRLLGLAVDKCQELNGRPLTEPSKDRDREKDRVKALAEVQRQLLFLGHLGKRFETAVLDEYHAVRGFEDHRHGRRGPC